MRPPLQFRLSQSIYQPVFDVHMFVRVGDVVHAAIPATLVAVDENSRMHDHAPMCKLSPDEAQMLMDELWRVGIRPSEGSGSAGQLAAVQAHLADMRQLTFNLMAADMPQKEGR